MIDVRLLRADPDAFRSALARRHQPDVIDQLELAIAGNQTSVAKAASAEQDAERQLAEAVGEVGDGNEALANARETRAAEAARAEAHQARSAEYARICVERFECVPQRLPEKLGFDPDEVRDPEAESAQLERLTADRERLGPVNVLALEEHREMSERLVFLTAQRDDLLKSIAEHPGVVETHDLHVWTVTSGFPALSAHVLVEPGGDCHRIRLELENLLRERFGLDHTTLQVEHVGVQSGLEIARRSRPG